MPADIHQFACLEDNYGYLVRDRATGRTAAIDVPDSDAYSVELKKLGWTLDLIVNTHWHSDHTGGNQALRALTGAAIVAPAEVTRKSRVDRIVGTGCAVELGETTMQVITTPGHTRGHLCYHIVDEKVLFSGDVLFAMGCGRLFEGSADQMWSSLSTLANLPPDTRVYCAHEYTAANARFALSVDPSAPVAERAQAIFERRARGEWTIPTTIGLELATNPFLRAHSLRPDRAPAAAFGEIRSAKDSFGG